MDASCTHDGNGTIRRSTGRGAGPGSRWRYRWSCGAEPDALIARVGSGEPMTIPELRWAAALLGRHVGSGRMDVLVARVRLAVRLEKLGA